MKAEERRKHILELVENNEISTQEELLNLLNKEGYNVTQSTISRDIRELRLAKVRTSKGFKYAVSNVISKKPLLNLQDSVLSVDNSGTMLVIKCKSGMASAVCAEIDTRNIPDIVGTIAGDDTIFALFRSIFKAEQFKKNFSKR